MSDIFNLTDTWNNAGTVFTSVKMNVTNTASNAASMLLDLQVSAGSICNVTPAGVLNLTGASSTFALVASTTQFRAGSVLIGFNMSASTGVAFSSNSTGASPPAGADSAGLLISSGSRYGIASSTLSTAADTILTRKAAAGWQFGAADAAAPVAQTLSVQSVVAGTTNTAGANATIAGSQGTGTGIGGNVDIQTATAGTTGSAQNALALTLSVRQEGTVIAGRAFTVATLPAAGTQGRRAWVTDATAPTFNGALVGGGAVKIPVFDNGTAWVSA